MKVTENKIISQFQVRHISFIDLKQHNIFQEQMKTIMDTFFTGDILKTVKKVLKKDNTRVIALPMFYG